MCLLQAPSVGSMCWEMENRVEVNQPLVPGRHRVSEHYIAIQTGKGGLVCKSNLGAVMLHFVFRHHMSRSREAQA